MPYDYYDDFEPDFIDYSNGEEPEQDYKPDPYFLDLKGRLKTFFEENKDAVLYMRQLQLKYENEYYHWITHNAVMSLCKEEVVKLIKITVPIKSETTQSTYDLHLHFFAHHTNRYPKRKINLSAKVVAEYSQDHITRSCGNRAEVLFAEALSMRGCMIKGKKVTKYEDKEWTATKHDLDYIFEKDKIVYGCEIKNTLSYIEKDELEVKLKMCAHLGIRPLFIMRYAPKTYNYSIYQAGGCALIFKTQIYDLSQKTLVEKIRSILGYDVDCPKAIPSGIVDRFEKWHNKAKNR